MDKFGKVTALTIGGISLLADIATACYKVEVTSFGNAERLTDFLTSEDEITMQFGVGEILRY